ncbi:calcitonin gene-related peptide type 1 receptor-like [Mya arenaria]|uniref:calcitonin gene-related peptide type 1 receptor-like n=1 Tax=Mya arenaria TaxID=6604 RepID=UPI0022E4FEC7|nr:calcitonin gene-related peptide type 1 receptor-like [Mya arenaria]
MELEYTDGMCRDRLFELPVNIFNVFSCSMCYKYLFHTGNKLTPQIEKPWMLVPAESARTHYSENFSVLADVIDANYRAFICNSLNRDDCTRWVDCCQSAIRCCQKQLRTPLSNFTTGVFCPRTWDGYSCFDDVLPSTRVQLSCPSYIEHGSTSAFAYKDCTENGTWWVNPVTGSEWTNYTTCVPKQDYHTVVYVALACNILSLLLLIPACSIFLGIRQLRVQKRIKLHICLFLSFIFASLVTVTWDVAVYMDRLQNERINTVMHRNSAGCKLLYILTRYVSTANFFWMFCEGFYLHRLIVHAFSPSKTLVPYYLFGWVGAWIPSLIYSIVRATKQEYNSSCWVHNIGPYEWLLYTPNLLCIAANVLFLANILKILCFKLQMHPNEPSNYRKALKATFVLVPLFGLQQFLVIYRPPPGTSLSFTYEILQKVIQNTQGATVALIFCFFNGEVYTYMRNCIGSHIYIGTSSKHHNRKNSMSSATQVTSYTTSARRNTKFNDNSDKSYMPLSASSTTQELTTPTNGHVTFSV